MYNYVCIDVLKSCHSHRRTVDSQSRVCL